MIYKEEPATGGLSEHTHLVTISVVWSRWQYLLRPFSLSGMIRKANHRDTVFKTYAMTGWRAGFGAGDPEIIGAFAAKVISQTISNLTTVSS